MNKENNNQQNKNITSKEIEEMYKSISDVILKYTSKGGNRKKNDEKDKDEEKEW